MLTSPTRIRAACFAAGVVALLLMSAPVRAGFLSVEESLPGFITLNSHDLYVSPDGPYLYATGPVVPGTQLGATVLIMRRDPATGGLIHSGLHSDLHSQAAYTESITLSPDGASLYVVTSKAELVVLQPNPSTGALTYVETQVQGVAGVDGLSSLQHVVLSPDGEHLYAGGNGPVGHRFAVFHRDASSGRLTFLATYPQPSGGAIAVSPDGLNVYAAGAGLLVFQRDVQSGTLTLLEQKRDGDDNFLELPGLSTLKVSPDGRFVYAGGEVLSNPTLVTLRRDPASGRLTTVHVEQMTDPRISTRHLEMAPDGSVLYTGQIGVLRRDPVSGRVKLVDVYDYAGDALALTPDGRDLYATDNTNNLTAHLRRRCGDGVTDPGEACDDGNNTGGDGCDVACAVEPCFACAGNPSQCTPVDGGPCDDDNPCTRDTTCRGGTCSGTNETDGTPCDDGDACTTGDVCGAGACMPGGAPVCGPCETCDRRYGCVGTFRTNCHRAPEYRSEDFPVTGSIDLRRGTGRRAFRWRWVGENPTTLEDFGNPMKDTGFEFCLFHAASEPQRREVVASVRVAPAETCGEGSCWHEEPRELVYRNPGGNATGVRHLSLRARKGRRASISLVAGGPRLGPHSLPRGPGTDVQLIATNGACWSAEFGTFVSVHTRARYAGHAGKPVDIEGGHQ